VKKGGKLSHSAGADARRRDNAGRAALRQVAENPVLKANESSHASVLM